jgi:23S rRNA (guanosine2251-2'-O)-methyltransferase
MGRKAKSADAGFSVLAGFHAVTGSLRRNPAAIEIIWFDRSRNDPRMAEVAALAKQCGVAARRVDRSELDRIGAGLRHQGLVARIRGGAMDSPGDLSQFLDTLNKDAFLLVLDRVQDPHNLGACLRSAECAGVDAVILPKDGAAPVTDTVRRVAAGAAEQVPLFYVTNLSRSLEALKERGIWVIGTSDGGDTTIYRADLTGPVALVLGGEGSGMRRLVTSHCDRVVVIPMAGSVSSLNVSVAAGVVLFEARRQRELATIP